MVHNAVVYEKACRLDRNDVVLGVAPFFHITGIVAHLAIAFHLGIPVVVTGRFDAGDDNTFGCGETCRRTVGRPVGRPCYSRSSSLDRRAG